MAGLPIALTKSGSSPSLLNGGLEKIDVLYWVAVVSLAGIVELENANVKEEKGKNYILGDCGFDPLGFFPKDTAGQFAMQTKEIKNGRLAMMASKYFQLDEEKMFLETFLTSLISHSLGFRSAGGSLPVTSDFSILRITKSSMNASCRCCQ